MTKERDDLPSIATKVNGIYLEDVVPGYNTLNIIGREDYKKEILSDDTKADGAKLKSAPFEPKELTVEYTIKSSDFDSFDAAFDKLKSIIGSTDEADFVFNGESDKYYTGVVTSNKCDLPGRAIRKGAFVINCLFPFKRSTALKTVSVPTSIEASSAEFTIDYQGTYPSKPILRATFDDADVGGNYSDDGDCGYIAFIDDDENIVQLGNPDAIDVDAYENTVTRINNSMSTVSGWQTSGGKAWGNKIISGSISVASLSDVYFGKAKGWKKPCAIPAYGTKSGWHSPIM